MSWFSKITGGVTAAASKASGRTDFLEAACAHAALVAAADGSIDDSEIVAAIKAVNAIEVIKNGFQDTQINQTMNRMIERANGGRVGKLGLMKEIEDIKGDKDLALQVLLVGADVADDNGIGAEEMAVLDKVAKALGIDRKAYIDG